MFGLCMLGELGVCVGDPRLEVGELGGQPPLPLPPLRGDAGVGLGG